MREIDELLFFAETVTRLGLPMPEPFSNIPHRWACCRWKHPRSGGASRSIYLGTRQKSLRTMFRIYNERDMEGKQGRGGGELTKLHTRAVPPNTRCPKRGLWLDREGGGGGRRRWKGGDAHSLFLAGVIGHREYPERYSRLL